LGGGLEAIDLGSNLDARKARGMINDSEAFMGICMSMIMIRYGGHDRCWDLFHLI